MSWDPLHPIADARAAFLMKGRQDLRLEVGERLWQDLVKRDYLDDPILEGGPPTLFRMPVTERMDMEGFAVLPA